MKTLAASLAILVSTSAIAKADCINSVCAPPTIERVKSLINEAHLFYLSKIPDIVAGDPTAVQHSELSDKLTEKGWKVLATFNCQKFVIILSPGYDVIKKSGDVILAHELSHAQDCLMGYLKTQEDARKSECFASSVGMSIARNRDDMKDYAGQIAYRQAMDCGTK